MLLSFERIKQKHRKYQNPRKLYKVLEIYFENIGNCVYWQYKAELVKCDGPFWLVRLRGAANHCCTMLTHNLATFQRVGIMSPHYAANLLRGPLFLANQHRPSHIIRIMTRWHCQLSTRFLPSRFVLFFFFLYVRLY